MPVCSICSIEPPSRDRCCPNCDAILVAQAGSIRKRPIRGWCIVAACFISLCVIVVYAGSALDTARASSKPAFDVHNPLVFQDKCGSAAWVKRTERSHNKPDALNVYYQTPSFGAGQIGIMILFFDSPSNISDEYRAVHYFSVPSEKLIDQPTALKILGCSE
mgnify:CR=1 FL=1